MTRSNCQKTKDVLIKKHAFPFFFFLFLADGNGIIVDRDKALLVEFDDRREHILQRIQDLVFEQEFRQSSRNVPLSIVLASLAGMHDQPSVEQSIRKQVQRLLINLR